jgi:hypothetical protein
MSRFPKATWRGPIPNKSPGKMVKPILGLILHVEQGSEKGTDSWFHNPGAQASAHFGNPLSGPLDQWVDTADKAWAEVAGNSRWISVEHEGYADKAPAPTASQIENDAQLLAWLHTTEGVPLQVTNSVNRPGLGWHGMGGSAWGGHYACPGDRIKNARKQIIARAQQIVAPPVPWWWHRPLSAGMSGADVFAAKRRLTRLGYKGMSLSTNYGPAVVGAVKDFQGRHGLPKTGVIDRATAHAIRIA